MSSERILYNKKKNLSGICPVREAEGWLGAVWRGTSCLSCDDDHNEHVNDHGDHNEHVNDHDDHNEHVNDHDDHDS